MSTFLEAATFQRMTRLSPYPHETARAISAEQFRPTKEKEHGIIERDSTEHGSN